MQGQYTPGLGAVSSGERYPPFLMASALGERGFWKSYAAVLGQSFPTLRALSAASPAKAGVQLGAPRALFVRGLDPRLRGERGPEGPRAVGLSVSVALVVRRTRSEAALLTMSAKPLTAE